MIRLYEHKAASFKTVSEGMERALSIHRKLAGVCREDDDGFRPVEGVDAPFALVVGAPPRTLRPHLRGKHKQVWWLAAPNSEGIPPRTVQMLNDDTYSVNTEGMRPILDGIFATSEWARDILRKAFPHLPVLLWQHGVLPEFEVRLLQRDSVRTRYDSGEFQLLHITSTVSRKGTHELLQAWQKFTGERKNLKYRLDLLVNPRHLLEFSELVKGMQIPSVMVAPGQSYDTQQLCVGMSSYHAVVQPSRAEGFGLVPLEARACGIPVAMTGCTGHSDHAGGPGVVLVRHQASGKSDDYSGATAPVVTASDVYDAMNELYEGWKGLEEDARQHAETLRHDWSWERRAESAIEELEKMNV
jgi:glycosyltransferase involved in cell wall biosynthesis